MICNIIYVGSNPTRPVKGLYRANILTTLNGTLAKLVKAFGS